MSSTTLRSEPSPLKIAGDSFAIGMILMLVINLLQRMIGLVRNLGFCQYLSDADLGHWAMANSFFVFAAPLVVCGLPGSFGKFSEYFRHRNGLGDYITRIALFCFVGLICSVIGMLLWPASIGWFVYGESTTWNIVGLTIIAFICQVQYNFAFDLAISLRRVRIVSSMQFLQSCSFMLLGIGALWLYGSWIWLLPSYAIACMLAAALGWIGVLKQHASELVPRKSITWTNMGRRIIPFAIALWAANLLTNSFELCDRYMLLHWSTGSEEQRQALVGQYFCGRIIPNLLSSLALTLSGILLPYMSADWEHNAMDTIRQRMRVMLLMVTLGFMGISVAGMICSPWLFEHFLRNRYAEAEAIMPMSLVQCTWSGLSLIAGAYLLCAERARQGNYILVLGLVANVVLNAILIEPLGIHGAMIATMVSTGIVLWLTCWRIHVEGCILPWRTYLVLPLPAVLLLGMIPTFCLLTILVFLAGRTNWLIDDEDRSALDAMLLPKLHRFGLTTKSLWPDVSGRHQ